MNETTLGAPFEAKLKVTPKDFFLWAGAMVALYTSIVSFLILLFEYIERTFPDPVTNFYIDPYAGGIRFAMASIIVLAPLTVLLLRFIRSDIKREPAKSGLWIRRWALMLTLFVAGATMAGDLVTLINTFLGGELTTRFILKVLAVFLVAGGGFLHFYADLRGYWNTHPGRAQKVGIAVGILALLTVAAGFFIIGSPTDIRMMRLDAQKESDLMNIQWQIVNYWQQKELLPENLSELADPLSGIVIPVDPQTGERYSYAQTGARSFRLCATFNRESASTALVTRMEPAMPVPVGGSYDKQNEHWQHPSGEACFDRTIDPERYPPYSKSLR